VQFRSHGGRTAGFNKLLRIEGDPLTGLKWLPRSAADARVVATASHPKSSRGGEKASAESKKSTAMDFSSAHKLEAAWKNFEGRAAQPTEGALLYEAFRA
jgi:hypothetical protein